MFLHDGALFNHRFDVKVLFTCFSIVFFCRSVFVLRRAFRAVELGNLSGVSVEGFRVVYICFYLSSLLSDLSFRRHSPVEVSQCW